MSVEPQVRLDGAVAARPLSQATTRAAQAPGG
jgi:hypothetical protein